MATIRTSPRIEKPTISPTSTLLPPLLGDEPGEELGVLGDVPAEFGGEPPTGELAVFTELLVGPMYLIPEASDKVLRPADAHC
jgi:hypothetical protein